MTIVVLGVLLANIVWAVINWKIEWNHVAAVWTNGPVLSHRPMAYLVPLVKFGGDIVVTSTATTLFGFSGFYGATGALFFSNMLSVVFFLPG